MEVIDYKNSIVNLSNSILKYFNLPIYHDTLEDLDKLLDKNKYKNIVLLLAIDLVILKYKGTARKEGCKIWVIT